MTELTLLKRGIVEACVVWLRVVLAEWGGWWTEGVMCVHGSFAWMVTALAF
jgi:hypothetical protein